MKTAAT